MFTNLPKHRNLFTKLLNYNKQKRTMRKPTQIIRYLSLETFRDKLHHGSKMQAWQIHSYGDALQLGEARIPILTNPTDLLVRVSASSLNPIDRIMLGGYGRKLFSLWRRNKLEFPLTVGRDFAGTVVDKGHQVGDKFKIGDKVYGFVPLHRQGCHSEAVLANKGHIRPIPAHLTPVQAASMPYVAMTAWSALFVTGELLFRQKKNCKVLVLGGSGGVGSFAVQLLKSQGCEVATTCATDAVDLMKSLGADLVVDYKKKGFQDVVAAFGKFSIILDCAKFGYENAPSDWVSKYYITLNSPLMVNTDQYGLFGGLAASALDLARPRLTQKRAVRWGFFAASEDGFKFIDGLLQAGKIRPVIHKVFKFDEMPKALETLEKGHLRGKIVVDFD